LGAIWVYSFEEGSKLVIDGRTELSVGKLIPKHVSTSPLKSTWNFVPITKDGLFASEIRTICENIRICHY
jgi:hypothetical protein